MLFPLWYLFFLANYVNLAWVWDMRGRKPGILERSLCVCVVASAFHVLSVLQIDVIILKELGFSC